MPWRFLPFVFAAVVTFAAGGSPAGAQEKAALLKRIKPMEPKPADSELRKLQKLRFNAALDEVKAAMLLHEQEPSQDSQALEAVFDAADRLTEASLDLYADPKNRIKIYERHVALAKEREKILSDRSSKTSADDAIALQRAVGHRANAEIALLKARRALEKTNTAKTNTAKISTAKVNTEKPTAEKPNTATSNTAKSNITRSNSPQPNATKPNAPTGSQ